MSAPARLCASTLPWYHQAPYRIILEATAASAASGCTPFRCVCGGCPGTWPNCPSSQVPQRSISSHHRNSRNPCPHHHFSDWKSWLISSRRWFPTPSASQRSLSRRVPRMMTYLYCSLACNRVPKRTLQRFWHQEPKKAAKACPKKLLPKLHLQGVGKCPNLKRARIAPRKLLQLPSQTHRDRSRQFGRGAGHVSRPVAGSMQLRGKAWDPAHF